MDLEGEQEDHQEAESYPPGAEAEDSQGQAKEEITQGRASRLRILEDEEDGCPGVLSSRLLLPARSKREDSDDGQRMGDGRCRGCVLPHPSPHHDVDPRSGMEGGRRYRTISKAWGQKRTVQNRDQNGESLDSNKMGEAMETSRAIQKGTKVKIRLGTEIEIATVVRPGSTSIRVRLNDGSEVKRKIARDVVEVLDGECEEA